MFATVIHFHPNLIFVGKAGAYQSGEHYENPLKRFPPCLAYKYKTRVDVNGSGKHSSLLRYGNDYCSKCFIVPALGWKLNPIIKKLKQNWSLEIKYGNSLNKT